MTLLTQLINQSGYDIFFPVIDEFLNFTIDSGLTNFYPIYRPELGLHNSGQLLGHPQIVKYISETSASNKHQVAILPFKPSAKIEKICRQRQWLYLSNPTSLNRLFEDKLKFPLLCSQNNIPQLPYKIVPLTQENFDYAKTEWGSNIIIQTHFGWAGNSTNLASDYSQVISKIPLNTPVKLTPYRHSYTLLNNCCLTSVGLFQSPPALQFTGLPEYTPNPYTTVGRQWPAPISDKVKAQVFDISQKVGLLLSSHKYRGFFGLDFLVDQDESVYVLECNPRLTASFAFYTSLELKAAIEPLFYLHLAEYLHLNYSTNDRFSNSEIIGSQLTPRLNPQNRITQVLNFDHPICPAITTPLILHLK